jgi:hypothetical protein
MDELAAARILEPPDLLAHRRLRAMDPLAGAGEAAGVDHRDEAAQEIEVEHGTPIHKSTRSDDII